MTFVNNNLRSKIMKKGYKGFDKDLQCRGFQYEVGKTYECETAEVSSKGFHYCKKIKDVLDYYPITSRFCEIEDLGKTVTKQNKSATTKIKIVKELTRDELVKLFKYKNDNLGKNNLGNWNTGNWNSGDFNLSENNAGCFNVEEHKLLFFDKETELTWYQWENSRAYDLLWNIDFKPTKWVYAEDMTDQEKLNHPSYETTGGYLKKLDISNAYQKWWDRLSGDEKQIIREIPNFDSKKFEMITGINTEEIR